ncbi:MAG: hypothetical protein PHU71_05550 [Candidatus Gracilibacteria bacterium]|nr:hypothetical protein [Candidatus Gracilibacteria bacterium]
MNPVNETSKDPKMQAEELLAELESRNLIRAELAQQVRDEILGLDCTGVVEQQIKDLIRFFNRTLENSNLKIDLQEAVEMAIENIGELPLQDTAAAVRRGGRKIVSIKVRPACDQGDHPETWDQFCEELPIITSAVIDSVLPKRQDS